ncbi:MAG TPA: hypothetical protein VFH51_20980, partial [Myxococcota bacterium]|nr:hypothetical protein [Myxococcota bacterium]
MPACLLLTLLLTSPASDAAGESAQPAFTAERRFVTTEAYTLPTDVALLGYSYTAELPFDTSSLLPQRSLLSLATGLTPGLQLDVRLGTVQEQLTSPLKLEGEGLGVRWAWQTWGVTWGNPTLGVAYSRTSFVPRVAVHLGLSGEPAPAWASAAEVTVLRELRGSLRDAYSVTVALGRTVGSGRWAVGGEGEARLTDRPGARFQLDTLQILVGPSLQWRPSPA